MASTDIINKPAANPGQHTRLEIYSQPASWQAAIDAAASQEKSIRALFARNADKAVVFVGCGSPYYLDITAAALYREQTGKLALAIPASEILFNIESAIPGDAAPLVIAVSRSGETSELVAACKVLKEKRGS
ncbi:MAG TPA: iron dicitrate transport regulator FecR, partial [Anaerolineae bacterium]